MTSGYLPVPARLAGPADIEAIVATLTTAFFDDPLWGPAFPDVERRTDPAFSADLGAFNALLQCFVSIARIAASGRMSTRSRIEDVAGWWFSFFMYFASGPPPARLRQLLALELSLIHI